MALSAALPLPLDMALVLVAAAAGLWMAGHLRGTAEALWLPVLPLLLAAVLVLAATPAASVGVALGFMAAAVLALLGAAQPRPGDALAAIAIVTPLAAVAMALAARLGVAPEGGWPGLGALALLGALCAADRLWSEIGSRGGVLGLLGFAALFLVAFGMLVLVGRTDAIALACLGIAALILIRVAEIDRRLRWVRPVALTASVAGAALVLILEVIPPDARLDPAGARATQTFIATQFRAWQAVLAEPLFGSTAVVPGAGGLARAALWGGLLALALMLLAVGLVLLLAIRRFGDAGSCAVTAWLAAILLGALSLSDPSAGEPMVALALALLLGASLARTDALVARRSRR